MAHRVPVGCSVMLTTPGEFMVVYNHWTGTVDWNGGIAKFSKIEIHTL